MKEHEAGSCRDRHSECFVHKRYTESRISEFFSYSKSRYVSAVSVLAKGPCRLSGEAVLHRIVAVVNRDGTDGYLIACCNETVMPSDPLLDGFRALGKRLEDLSVDT